MLGWIGRITSLRREREDGVFLEAKIVCMYREQALELAVHAIVNETRIEEHFSLLVGAEDGRN